MALGEPMLNWLMKRAARSFLAAQKEVQQDEKLKDARKLGQDAAKATVEQLDAYVKARREQLRINFINVLSDRIELAKGGKEAPPIIEARIEYDIFCRNADELRETLPVEISNAFREWKDVFVQMEAPEVFDDAVKQRIDNIVAELKLLGAEELIRHADELKDRDAKWRTTFPERSAEWPDQR
jgi:hypothetical protein